MKYAVRLEHLRKDYDLEGESLRVLKGITLDIPQGDYVAIMGPSGSGKSTLLNVLGCLDRPTSGQYILAGQDISELDDDQLSEIRSSHIGFIFQSYNLIPQLSVIENIEVPLYYQNGLSSQNRNYCQTLASEVGLSDRLKHRPAQLSGGQQQRAGIARSLVSDPDFLLADEPTGNLDSVTTVEILALLDRLNESGKTIIIVTHEDEVGQRARRIIRLEDGLIQSDKRSKPPAEIPKSAKTDLEVEASQGSLFSWLFAFCLIRFRAWQLGVKSLLLHPMQSLLTVLGVFVGVASVIWLLAIGEGISAKAQEQIEGLGANNIIVVSDRPPTESNEKRYDPYGVTQNDYERLIKLVPSIVKAAPVREQNRMELKYRDRLVMSRMVGCTAEYLDVNQLELKQGHFLSAPDLKSANKMCAISDSVAQQLFPIEDPIGKSVKLQGYYFRVIGVIAEKAESEGIDDKLRSHDFSDDIYIPLSVVQELFANSYSQTYSGVPIVGQVTLQLRDKSEVLQTAEIVRKSLEQWHDMEDYELVVPMELLNQARSTRLMFICLMSMVAAISLLVGGIGIMNIMLSSVTERTREIGIRRALGAKQKDITRQFLVETVVLSILGGLTGVLGGLTCKLIIENLRLFLETSFPEMMASMPESLQSVTPIVVTWSIPVAFGISVLVGVVFGMYPAGRAAAMKPIDALRHVA